MAQIKNKLIYMHNIIFLKNNNIKDNIVFSVKNYNVYLYSVFNIC
jgi:hypothetical protein